MRSYFDGLLRYFEFSGRSTRAQYWLFSLFSALCMVGALFGDAYLSGIPVGSQVWGPLTVFAALFHAVPGVTVTVRRLHDIGRSGWWYCITIIPILGGILLLVWMCWPSDDYDNAYGDHPRDSQPAPTPRNAYTTIPRQIRMGSNPARPAAIGRSGLAEPERFI